MTNEQNIALVAKHREAEASGDASAVRRVADAIVRGNQGLVRKLAMRFARPQSEEDKEDAMQAGSMGVLRAIKDFDPTLGSFSTHAGNHIRDYVQRWSGKNASVSKPRSASMPASVARAAQRFRQTHGSEPDASDLHVTDAQFIEWSSGTHFVEIDSSNDDDRPGVQLTYGDEQSVEHTAKCLQVEAAWEAATQQLSPRNQSIARRFFIEGHTASMVASDYGLTHGRVLQICKRIEVRLRRAIDPAYKPDTDWEADTRARVTKWKEAKRKTA